MPKEIHETGCNIVIAGVGGQQIMLTGGVIGVAAMNAGYDVKVSELHGMAERGGSVVAYVRYGNEVESPCIEYGQADIILAFEELEALRFAEHLKETGLMIVNTNRINPLSVMIGAAQYPENVMDRIKQTAAHVVAADALQIAKDCGEIKTLHIVLIGMMAQYVNIDKECWHMALKKLSDEDALDVNMEAFERGYRLKMEG